MDEQWNPYVSSAADLVPPVAPEEVLAGRGARLAAKMVEGLPGIPVGLLAAVATPFLLRNNRGLLYLGGALLALLVVAWIVYNLRLMATRGQTWGKKMLKIKVVRSDGTPLNVWRWILLRAAALGVLGLIPVVGYILAVIDPLLIFRDDRRCLHDLIADTKVVEA